MAKSAAFRILRRSVSRARAESRAAPGTRPLAHTVSRRAFLETGALATAAVALSRCSSGRRPPILPRPKRGEPVVILGAGAAGLAAAYTLAKEGVPFRIVEASARVGGRISTQRDFNADGQFVERGAELVDTTHTTLIDLAEELGLTIEDFTAADAGVEAECFHFEGRLRTHEEFVAGLAPLIVRMERALEEVYGGSDLGITYQTAGSLPGAVRQDRISIAEFLDAATDVDPWIKNAIAVAYVGEMGRETSEQSSLNLLELIDTDPSDGFSMFGESDESKRVRGGNASLPEALLRALTLDGTRDESEFLWREHTLVSIREEASGLALRVRGPNGATQELLAGRVICTLPFPVLRDVSDLSSLGLSPVKLRCIRELGYGTNSKLMLSFTNRFWRRPSDAAPASTGALYGDFGSQCFWETSRLQAGRRGVLTNFLGGEAGLAARLSTRSTALGDLSSVHGEATVQPSAEEVATIVNWTRVPTAKGSYSCPLPGQLTSIWGSAGEPELGGRLQFAGEHTSLDFAGFMNGAYESGILAARAVMAL